MATMVDCICKNKECKKPFRAKQADRDRGWGLYCSKSCKARVQTRRERSRGNPNYHRDGPLAGAIAAGRRLPTRDGVPYKGAGLTDDEIDQAMSDMEGGWDGHKIWL